MEGMYLKPDQIKVGKYNEFELWVPRNEFNDIIGKVAYFRQFGSTMIYVGHGASLRFDVCVCYPVHPSTRKIDAY